MTYAYQSDNYCDSCAEKIIDSLYEQAENVDDADIYTDTGDTDDYPQQAVGSDEADYPKACCDCGEFLENSLTTEGYTYLQGMINEYKLNGRGNEEILKMWADYYDIPWDNEEEEDDE